MGKEADPSKGNWAGPDVFRAKLGFKTEKRKKYEEDVGESRIKSEKKFAAEQEQRGKDKAKKLKEQMGEFESIKYWVEKFSEKIKEQEWSFERLLDERVSASRNFEGIYLEALNLHSEVKDHLSRLERFARAINGWDSGASENQRKEINDFLDEFKKTVEKVAKWKEWAQAADSAHAHYVMSKRSEITEGDATFKRGDMSFTRPEVRTVDTPESKELGEMTIKEYLKSK